MNIEQIIDFLESKPGYAKEGKLRLALHLEKKGYEVEVEDCGEALKMFRSRIQTEPVNPKTFKRMFFDIETSPNVGWFWRPGFKVRLNYDNILKHAAVICVSWKWEGEDKVHHLKWGDNWNDFNLLNNFVQELNKADEVIAHNCVTEDTKILKEDLTWVNAGDLKLGDELVGFDEGNTGICRPGGKWTGNAGKHRNFKKSIITGYEKKLAPVYRITFDDGSHVDTTNDHKWLGMAPKDQNHRWYTTEYLKEGYRCMKPFDVWEEPNNYNSGYLSGMIDADGSVSKDGYYNTSIYQSDSKNLDICNKIADILNEENIEYSEDFIETSKIISTTYKGSEKINYPVKTNSHVFRFLGDVYKKISYIGKYKIQKGIRNFTSDNLGCVKMSNDRVKTIVSKELIGEKPIVVMQTSSKTFIGNGYMMHNCDRFDIKWLRTRCLLHGLPFNSTIKTLDTLTKVKKYFNFPTNKLNDIGRITGLGEKIHTSGDLWNRVCFHNDEKALIKMIEYCDNDVVLLEDIYHKIQPYINTNTHVGVHLGKDKFTCPSCGSEHVKYDKPLITRLGTIQRHMECRECGSDYVISNTEYNKNVI